MPIFSSDALGIGVGMDGKNFGMSLRTRRVWVNVQLAETAPERLVAFHVKRLIAKEQDLILRQRLVQLFDLAVTERLGERQAVDLGANAGRDRRDVDGFVAHGATFQSANIDHISGKRLKIPHTGKRVPRASGQVRSPPGRRTVKTEPLPGSLVTVTSP